MSLSSIGTKLDANQVLKQAYDESENRLRVDALVSATISDVTIVDKDGDPLNVNPDGSIDVNVLNSLELDIDAASGDNIAISDGTNTATVGTNGGLNVNILNSSAIVVTNQYNEANSVPANSLTNILTYTPSVNGKIKQVNVAGNNKAIYTIEVASSVVDKAYTWYTSYNHEFDCGEGLAVIAGQQILVRVIHDRPFLGDFNARLQFVEE